MTEIGDHFDPEEWNRNDHSPGQLQCTNCGALYITDTESDNSCPVCYLTSWDAVGPRHNTEQ